MWVGCKVLYKIVAVAYVRWECSWRRLHKGGDKVISRVFSTGGMGGWGGGGPTSQKFAHSPHL